MEIKYEELVPIRRNKSFIMTGNRYETRIRATWLDNLEFNIPMSKTRQIMRGLLSYNEKFYRRKK